MEVGVSRSFTGIAWRSVIATLWLMVDSDGTACSKLKETVDSAVTAAVGRDSLSFENESLE